MSSTAYTPSANQDCVFLGAGAIYFNYGEVSETLIGATRGGSTFSVDREIREVGQDGTYGMVKGMRRKSKIQPSMKIKAMELDTDNYSKFFAGMTVTTTNPNYDTVTENVDIVTGDYLTNVAFVGENLNGEDIVIVLKNALGDGKIEFAIEDKSEIVPEVVFTGHYDSSDLRVVPYEIRFPKLTPDTTSPTVACTPLDGATGVAVDADVVLTFSEAIKTSTINSSNIILMKADGTLVANAITYNAGQTIVTLNPSSNMAGSTAHVVIVTTNVKDINNNAIATTNAFNFTTA